MSCNRRRQRTDTLLLAAETLMQSDFFARLDRTTRRLDQMTSAVVGSADRWAPSLERAVRSMDEVMAKTSHLVAVMDSTAPELRATVGELPPLLSDTRLLLADLRAGANQGAGLRGLMQDLTVAGDHLARVTSRLDRDPASLLRSRQPPPKNVGPEIDD